MTASGTFSPKRAAISCPQAPATLTRAPALISRPFAVATRNRTPSRSTAVTAACSRISAPACRAARAKEGATLLANAAIVDAAGLAAAEAALEQHHRDAAPAQMQCGRATRGAAADDG